MTRMLLKFFGLNEDRIEVVPDRLGHDFRYSISGNKLKRFGFKYKHKDLESEIEKLCEWHVNNEEWWRRAIKLSEEK
jgi:dTDP-glucose 4,6-dehydratase